MKKRLAVVFACVLVAAGCSNGNDEQADTTVTEEEGQQETNENEEQQDTTDQEESNDQDQESNDEGQEDTEENDQDPSEEESNETSLSKEEAKQVVIQAETKFDEIANNTEEDTFIIKGYESKADIVKELTKVMSESLAKPLTDAYYAERDGELYLQPQGGPLWFNQEGSFTLKQNSDQEYVVIQKQSSEMSGDVEMHYTITYNGESWVLHQMKSQQQKQGSGSGSKVSKEEAVEQVRKHIGTQGENVKIEFDHMDGERYVIHVYEVVEQESNTHTATKGWYYVDPNTGNVSNMMN